MYVHDRNPAGTRIVGSPLYLSPETIRNRKLDHRSDMYSLGATFFHLMAGTPPYSADSLRDLMLKHLREPVPSLRKRAPDAPDFLCAIVEKMMAKDPDERFARYAEIVEGLDASADHSR